MAQMIGVTKDMLRERLGDLMESGKMEEAIAQANQAMAGMAAQAGEEIRFDPAAPVAEPVEDALRSGGQLFPMGVDGTQPVEESAAEGRNWFRTVNDETPEPAPSDPGGGDINPDTGLRNWYNPREGEPPINTDPTHWETDGILTEANLIVNGTRANDYGENSLPRVAQYWSTYLGKNVTGRDVANLMILLKVAREGHAVKRDNHVDIAGYVALADQLKDAA